MANKLRMIITNLLDVSTLAASSESPLLPIQNVKAVPRSKVWRSATAAETTITGNFYDAKIVNSFVFGRHNFVTGVTYRITLYDQLSQAGTLLADSGPISYSNTETDEGAWAWGQFLWGSEGWGSSRDTDLFRPPKTTAYYFSTDISSVLSFKVEINVANLPLTVDAHADSAFGVGHALYASDASGASGITWWADSISTKDAGIFMPYFEIGRMFVGTYFEPTYNMSFNHSMSWEEKTKQYRTDAGTLRSDFSLPFRKYTLNLSVISEADRATLQEGLTQLGLRKDFYLSEFPETTCVNKENDFSAIVKLTKVPKYSEIQANYYKSSYTMEEV
jgi:hypothetical protein